MNGEQRGRGWFVERVRILVGSERSPVRAGAAPRDPRRRRRRAPRDFFPPKVHGLAGPSPGASDSIIDVAKLEDAFKWAAGGFTAVAGLLVFFGIKEGVLDQALRLNAAATLLVFTLLGIGVVAALFAPAIDPASRMRLWAVLLALFVLMGGTGFFLPDLGVFREEQLEQLFGRSAPPGGAYRPLLLVALAALLLIVTMGGFIAWSERRGSRSTLMRAALATAAGAILATALGYYLFFSGEAAAEAGVAEVGLDGSVENLVTVLGVLGALSVIAWVFARRKVIPTVAGLVIIAVGATSTGLYAATKLAVQSKMLAVVPQVVGTIEDSDSGSVVAIHAKAGRMRGFGLVVRVEGVARPMADIPVRTAGTRPAGHSRAAVTVATEDVAASASHGAVTLWQEVLRPDSLDEVDQSIEVPIVPQRWENLKVTYCITGAVEPAPTCIENTEETVTAIRNPASEVGIGQVTAHIGRRGENLVARFAATDLAPGAVVQVALCWTVQGRHGGRLAMATLAPGVDDTARWRSVIPMTPNDPPADRWALRMRTYPPGPSTQQQWVRVATYTP